MKAVQGSESPVETVPAPKSIGRAPLEVTSVLCNGERWCQYGVYPGNKTDADEEWSVDDKPPGEKKTPTAKSSGTAKKSAKKKEPAERQLWLHYRTGKEKTSHELSPDEILAYDALIAALNAAPGIHLSEVVDGRLIASMTNNNGYFLVPKRGKHNLEMHYMFRQSLWDAYECAVGMWVSGRGVSAVAITAVEDGLKMLQLPFASKSHHSSDAFDPKDLEIRPTPQARSAFRVVYDQIRRKSLNPASFEDPIQAFLKRVFTEKLAWGEIPAASDSLLRYGSIEEGLTALAKQPRRPAIAAAIVPIVGALVEEEAPPPKKAPKKKSDGDNPKKPR